MCIYICRVRRIAVKKAVPIRIMIHLVKRSHRAGKILIDKLTRPGFHYDEFHSFNPKIFVEHLPYTSHCPKHHGYSE